MLKKYGYGEGPFFSIINYVYWLIFSNIIFMILILPFIFMAVTSIPPYNIKPNIIIFFLFSLPVGPAFTALLSLMGKLVRDKDLSLFKDFLRMYKANFKQSILFWCIELVLLIILYLDLNLINNPIKYGIYILIILVILTGLSSSIIISRFSLKNKDILRLALRGILTKWQSTLFMISIIIVFGAIFNFLPQLSIFCLFSGLAIVLMFYSKDYLTEIEGIIISPNNKTEDL